jgi:hypothetical protein
MENVLRASLVDNTTLTAVQRLLGQIRVGNLYNIDGDITAFEGFIKNTLFFDRIYTVDDYKPQFTSARRSFFNFVNFIDLKDQYYSALSNVSRSHGETLHLNLRGQKQLNGKLQEILSLIDMNFVGAWRMSGSNFFLYLEILTNSGHGDHFRYGPLIAAIRSQGYSIDGARNAEAASPDCTIEFSDGRNALVRESGQDSATFGVDPELPRLISHLNWLAYRSYFYLALASNEGLSLNLHPIRHAFLAGFAKHALGHHDVGTEIISRLKGHAKDAVSRIREISDPEIFRADLPMFTAWIAANSKTHEDFIPTAMILRDHKSLKKMRAKLDQIELLRLENDVAAFRRYANKMYSELMATIDEVKESFSVTTSQGIPTAPFVAAANIPIAIATGGVTVPDPNLNVPKPRWYFDAKYKFSYRAFLRNMLTDLATVGSLGGLHDKIKSGVVETKDANFPTIKYHPRGMKNSDWKILLD